MTHFPLTDYTGAVALHFCHVTSCAGKEELAPTNCALAFVAVSALTLIYTEILHSDIKVNVNLGGRRLGWALIVCDASIKTSDPLIKAIFLLSTDLWWQKIV